MTPADIDRVFGRGRLKMATGEHVEVFREESQPGQRRRYTKRFLCTREGDFRHWTEREWRILARLVGHGIGPVPDVVQYDRGANGRPAMVQTYDAGVTVDHWATLLPVQRDGRHLRHIFEDCAHWWALANHCLIALDAIHDLHLVHLDLKADNVCIPLGPADFDPQVPGQVLQPAFGQLTLIDFAFSLVSGESLATALPIGHQTDYDYQSPRLLRALEAGRQGDLLPTRQLDWRCDIFSLAAMLRRHLPADGGSAGAWTRRRDAHARALVDRLFEAHDGAPTAQRPHRELIGLASAALRDSGLASSLARGWQLAADTGRSDAPSPTPITRIALPVVAAPQERIAAKEAGPAPLPLPVPVVAPGLARGEVVRRWLWVSGLAMLGAASVPFLAQGWSAMREADQRVAAAAPTPQSTATPAPAPVAEAPAVPASAPAAVAAPAPVPAPAPAPAPAAEPPPRVTAPAPRPVAKSPAPNRKTTVAAKPVVVARKTPAQITPAPKPWGPASKLTPPPVTVAAAPAPEPTTTAAPTPPPMVASTPAPAPAAVAPAASLPEEFGARADALIAEQLPRIAQRAERQVLRVLHLAAEADRSPDDGDVPGAARTMHLASDDTWSSGITTASTDARRLNEAASRAFWTAHSPSQALGLQLRAFGANPLDAEIAGNLAFYYLKQRPAVPDAARRLALYALTLPETPYVTGRLEDWTTFAIASALVGRERDSRNAFFVTLALTPTLEKQCRAAQSAYASHGAPLRAPAEAMLARIRTWGRSNESPFCRWPPNWWAG